MPIQPQNEAIRVPPDEVVRVWDDIQRQHAEERGQRAQALAQRSTVMVPEDELRRTMAAITQRHAEERLRERTARLRSQRKTGESDGDFDGRRAEGAGRTRPPATPGPISSSPQIPIPQATPHAPPPRKRRREPQPEEGLLTPPPTMPDRPRKRPRPSQETDVLQRNFLDTVLSYHKSRFRDKEKESTERSWCNEVPLALQVETAQSFHQAFTDDGMLPILHYNFCYRKQPPSELTEIRWRRHLTPSLLQQLHHKVHRRQLQVRKSRVRAALSWLQGNNPLYEHVTIYHGEIDGWRYADGSDVPILIMDSMQREEPSVAEKTQTDHIVLDTDRGLEENRITTIEEIVASAQTHSSDDSSLPEGTLSNEQDLPLPGDPPTSNPGPEDAGGDGDVILETTSSGMFPLNGPAAFEEADKLSFLADAIQASRTQDADGAEPYTMQVRGAEGHPFILVERGTDFADNLHEDFFPRTFPKLFPWGRGGPKALLHLLDRERQRGQRGQRHQQQQQQQQAPEAAERLSNHSLSY
ncbi:hypothetical protein NW757_014467 [Fusarium falciforme]|nr:hypothetical protein NW757_014467 [Fusarium falciforme]